MGKYLNFINFVSDTILNLYSISNNSAIAIEIWCILSKILTKYLEDSQNINESTTIEHNFKTMENVLSFPFSIIELDDESEVFYNKFWSFIE